MAQKLIRFGGITLHWDLWDASTKEAGAGTPKDGVDESESVSSVSRVFLLLNSLSVTMLFGYFLLKDGYVIGPDAQSMIASACLLSLPSDKNFITLHILHARDCSSVMNIRPTLVDLSADIDCVFSALCPSQIFWLKACITQLNKYFKAYSILQTDESGASNESETYKKEVIGA